MFGRTLRLLFRRWLRLQLLFWRWVGSRIGWILTVLALLGVIGWLSVQAASVRRATPADARTAAVAPSAATESYLKGQQSYNAGQMWDSYSTTYQSTQIEKGFGKDNLQLQADSERKRRAEVSGLRVYRRVRNRWRRRPLLLYRQG